MSTVKITSQKQFELLVQGMKKKPHLAKNFKKGLPSAKNEWSGITEKLNAIGPPMRESMEWQRVSKAKFFLKGFFILLIFF